MILKRQKHIHLKDTLTQEQIVTDGLALSEELENTYNLLQDISKALINKNVSDLRKLLNCKDTIGYQMNITLKTFKRCLHDLLNAARFTESNGCLKGTNRKIKQIERTAYISRIKSVKRHKAKQIVYYNDSLFLLIVLHLIRPI